MGVSAEKIGTKVSIFGAKRIMHVSQIEQRANNNILSEVNETVKIPENKIIDTQTAMIKQGRVVREIDSS